MQTGVTSYHVKKFEGRKTANGEIFSHSKLTAEHKTLACGTKVKVTNFRNDKSVIVTINDCLSQQSKRTIDLSRAAAKKLDFIRKGKIIVRIEIVEPSNEQQY